MTLNHHLLCSLGVGHNSLTKVVEMAQSMDLHCKLTGAGGGGCAVVLSGHRFPTDDETEEESEETRKLDNLLYRLRLVVKYVLFKVAKNFLEIISNNCSRKQC